MGFDVTEVSDPTGLGAVGVDAAVERRLEGLTVRFNGERDRSRVYKIHSERESLSVLVTRLTSKSK